MRIYLLIITYIGFMAQQASYSCDFSDFMPHDLQAEIEFGLSRGITALPAIAKFQHEDKELQYIACAHGIGTDSPTLKLIRNVLEEFYPECLIVEGFDNQSETIQGIISTIENIDLDHCEEPLYAASLAHKKRIPFIGGEPTDDFIIQTLQSKNFMIQDVFYYYCTRQIPELYRQKRIQNEDDLPNTFKEFLKVFKFGQGCTYEDYQNWLKEKCKLEFTFKNFIDANTPGTEPALNGNHLQKIAYEIELIRDTEIVTKILDAWKSYKRTLIIYGSTHYYRQHRILESYLCKPTYQSYESEEKSEF